MKEGYQVTKSLFIKDLIRHVHKELLESQAERKESGELAIFEVEKMIVEVNFVITESKEAKGGLDFKVITVGGKKEYQQQQIHKITLSLTALPQEQILALKDLEKHSSHFMPRKD